MGNVCSKEGSMIITFFTHIIITYVRPWCEAASVPLVHRTFRQSVHQLIASTFFSFSLSLSVSFIDRKPKNVGRVVLYVYVPSTAADVLHNSARKIVWKPIDPSCFARKRLVLLCLHCCCWYWRHEPRMRKSVLVARHWRMSNNGTFSHTTSRGTRRETTKISTIRNRWLPLGSPLTTSVSSWPRQDSSLGCRRPFRRSHGKQSAIRRSYKHIPIGHSMRPAGVHTIAAIWVWCRCIACESIHAIVFGHLMRAFHDRWKTMRWRARRKY